MTSGTDVRRPKNVSFSGAIDSEPTYGYVYNIGFHKFRKLSSSLTIAFPISPTRKMDYELEMGYFISQPVPYGESMPIAEAKEHIFGFVMLNDWSARDHQLFEMRPLGPFHSKGFGTSISNWIGTLSTI